MGLNGRREKLILRAVTVMWSAGTGGEVRRPGHLFWCALQRSCPTFAWAATEPPCPMPPAENAQGPAAEGSGSQQPMPLGKRVRKRLPPSSQNFLYLFWPGLALNYSAGGGLKKNTTSDALRWGNCSSSPLNLLSQTSGAMGTGLWNSTWLLCSRGKLSSPPAAQEGTACWRTTAGHEQAAVPWATKQEPGRGWQPPLWRFRSPQHKEQAALAVPTRQTGSINRAPANHWGMCLALCVEESPPLSSCFSPPSSSHSSGVHVSVTAVPPMCPLLFPDL